MSGKDLLFGIGEIEHSYLQEMEEFVVSKGRKLFSKLLLTAAIISALAIGAIAGNVTGFSGNWFALFFSDGYKETATEQITPNQQELLDSGLTAIHQSVQDQGYTITMESGLCDGRRMLVKYRIDAPEGIVLDGRNYGISEDIRLYSGINHEPIGFGAMTSSSSVLPDDNPNDNSIPMLLEVHYEPKEGDSTDLANGTIISIQIPQIMELSGYGEDSDWNSLCEGNWEFELVFDNNLLITDSTELLTKPIRCNVTMWVDNRLLHNKDIPMTAKAISFELRALSGVLKIKRPLIAWFAGVTPTDSIQIVMKNGQVITANWQMTRRRSTFDECLFELSGPVFADDVDYVEFSGGKTIPMISGEGD